MINDEMQVTFGVEFECVLAFHQTLLQKHLDNIGDLSHIIKNITEAQRTELRTGGLDYIRTRPKYMGWALTSESPFPSDRIAPQHDPYTVCHREFGFRPYMDEIIHIAQALLPGPPEVHSLRKKGKRMDFSKWHLSEDPSLVGVDKKTMQAQLGDRIVDVEEWDSHGVELVSRVLPTTAASFDEIEDHLKILRGTNTSLHGAITTPFCGMHVHVGLPVSIKGPLPTFNLATLQHLAYILVMYELAISTVLSPCRRAGSIAAEFDIVTNLDNFSEATLADNLAKEDDFDWDNWSASTSLSDTASEPDQAFQEDLISYAVTRRLIFAPDMSVAKLSKLMCGERKGHIVNFTYLAREDGFPRTVEFRQHHGSLDPEGVRWWVMFVTGLVKLAAHMAAKFGADHGYAGEGYPHSSNSGNTQLEELWELMEFDEGGQEFFRAKVKEFSV